MRSHITLCLDGTTGASPYGFAVDGTTDDLTPKYEHCYESAWLMMDPHLVTTLSIARYVLRQTLCCLSFTGLIYGVCHDLTLTSPPSCNVTSIGASWLLIHSVSSQSPLLCPNNVTLPHKHDAFTTTSLSFS